MTSPLWLRLCDKPVSVEVLIEYMEIIASQCQKTIEKGESHLRCNPRIMKRVAEECRLFLKGGAA